MATAAELVVDVRLRLYGSPEAILQKVSVDVCGEDETRVGGLDSHALYTLIEKKITDSGSDPDGGVEVLSDMLALLAVKATLPPVPVSTTPTTGSVTVVPATSAPVSTTTTVGSTGLGGVTSVSGGTSVVTSTSSSASGTSGSIHYHKDFKFVGKIGDRDGDISYLNFMRQVTTAVSKGHLDSEIVDSVICAIHPSVRLRGYLEGRENLKLPTLQKIIRTFYGEKSSTELYQSLCNLTQEKRESPRDFLYRALELKQKILFASKETELSYDAKLVERQFQYAVATGLRDDLLRTEVKVLLQNYTTDEQLVQGLFDAHQQLEERRSKITPIDHRVSAKELAAEQPGVLEAIQALRLEVKELQRQSTIQPGNPVPETKSRDSATAGTDRDARRRRNACKACIETGVPRCFHCFFCGSSEHYRRYCPSKKTSQNSTPTTGASGNWDRSLRKGNQ